MCNGIARLEFTATISTIFITTDKQNNRKKRAGKSILRCFIASLNRLTEFCNK